MRQPGKKAADQHYTKNEYDRKEQLFSVFRVDADKLDSEELYDLVRAHQLNYISHSSTCFMLASDNTRIQLYVMRTILS